MEEVFTTEEAERIEAAAKEAEEKWAGKYIPAANVAKMLLVHLAVIDKTAAKIPGYQDLAHMRFAAELESLLDTAE